MSIKGRKTTIMPELNKIYIGDALEVLKTFPDEWVNCVVTSPPYWGLRNYGQDGQLGLEKTPEEYVDKLVGIFREIRRVLKRDGTVFLNLGDSYYGSGKGRNPDGSKWSGFMGNKNREMAAMTSNVQHAASCDIFDKEPVNCQESDHFSENLCGVCQQVSRRKFHKESLPSSMLIASLFLPNQESREFLNDHFPTLDFFLQVNRILISILDFLHCENLSDEQLLSFYQSMPGGFFQQLLVLCLARGNFSSCLLCGRSLTYNVPESFHKSYDFLMQFLHNQGNALPSCQQDCHNLCRDMVSEYYNEILSYFNDDIQPQSTINNYANLKPKDLIGIPWMVAFALRDDGWYLRSDIIWHKRNPMPESVTDRPTKSHEYIFLLTKSAKYYYDAESIAEPINEDTKRRYERAWNGDGERGYPGGVQNHIKNFMDPENEKRQWANKRSVWTVNTQPFSEAHFAVYPEKLIVPCILAGCPKDGIVLDPFIGSGTTFIVSRKLERNCVGIDLGYKDISDRRIYKELGMFK